MALPKIARVTYETTIPSTKKKIKFRPFLVKEEKVLILAKESGDSSQMLRAVEDVIDACVLTKGFSSKELPTFDNEYLYLVIRSKSIGEEIDVEITCPDDDVTTVMETILVNDICVVFNDEHKNQFKINDKYSIQMKYPTLSSPVNNLDGENVTFEESLKVIASCVDIIYTEDGSMWSASESTLEEMVEWLEALEEKEFDGIEKFFTTMPRLSHTVTVTNPKTNVTSDVVLEGFGSFLTFAPPPKELKPIIN